MCLEGGCAHTSRFLVWSLHVLSSLWKRCDDMYWAVGTTYYVRTKLRRFSAVSVITTEYVGYSQKKLRTYTCVNVAIKTEQARSTCIGHCTILDRDCNYAPCSNRKDGKPLHRPSHRTLFRAFSTAGNRALPAGTEGRRCRKVGEEEGASAYYISPHWDT
jgi:hypothetical protein